MSPLSLIAFDLLANRAKASKKDTATGKVKRASVRVPFAWLTGKLPAAITTGQLDEALGELESAGLACRWSDEDGESLVTLGPAGAARIGVKLNPNGTRWVPAKTKEPSETYRVLERSDGSATLTETDISNERGYSPLSEAEDPRAEIDTDEESDPGRLGVLVEEKKLGLVRKVLPIVGDLPWPVPGQSTAPIGPSHLKTTGPDPRKVGIIAGKIAPASCGVCGGRQLRPVTMNVVLAGGKNFAVRPTRVVESGEFCAACNRSWQEMDFPQVRAIPDPKTTTKAKGKPSADRKPSRRRGA